MTELGKLVVRVDTGGPTSATGSFIYIDLSSIDAERKLIVSPRQLLAAEAPSRARQRVKPGDVLVSTVRPNLNGVALIPNELDGAIASTGFCVLRSIPGQLDARYLFHWVRSDLFVGEMVRRATGASYPAVSDAIVKGSRIPLPSLPEQRRIASILDETDALRAKRRRALALLDDLADSIFFEMFGDPAREKHRWENKPLGSLAVKYSDGPFGSNLKSSDYRPAGVRVIRLQNIGVGKFLDRDRAYISDQHYRDLERHECLPGDVLIGTLGEPNLRACLQPDGVVRAINKADCVQFRADPNQVTAQYIVGLLNQPSVGRMAESLILGQTRGRISMGRLRGFEVPTPPLDRQREYSSRVRAAAEAEAWHRAHLTKLDELFAFLQHRAFSGHL